LKWTTVKICIIFFLETTRSLYEKKLSKLLETSAVDNSIINGSTIQAELAVGENGNSNLKNGEFSADEEEEGAEEEEDDQPSVVVRKAATPLR
jgi:hypothetical protein